MSTQTRQVPHLDRRWVVLIAVAAAAIAIACVAYAGTSAAPAASAAYARTSATPTGAATPQPAPTTASIVCGGDIIGAQQVAAYIRAHGADRVLAGIKPVIKAADLAFANLESPLSNKGTIQAWKDIAFRGDPRLAPALARAGFDVMTMANNHALDYHAPALLDCLRRLKTVHVRVVGAGATAAAAHAAAIFRTKSGLRVAFLGYSDILPAGYVAGSGPGIAAARTNMARVKADIRAAKRRADIVVVAFHWGVQLRQTPTTEQLSEAHAAINAGADLVMSHHPHVLEGLQAYHGGLICYSFGNLVFNHGSRLTGETILLRMVISKTTIRATLIPVYATSSTGVPSLVHGSAAQRILTRMRTLSARLGTIVRISGIRATVVVKR